MSVDPNAAIRNEREATYPQQVWYLIACSISLLVVLRAISWLWYCRALRLARCHPSSTDGPPPDLELREKTSNTVGPLAKVGTSVLSLTRIVAFRLSIPVVYGSRTTLAEAVIPAAYLGALLTWELINTRDIVTGENFSTKYWANRAGALAASQLTFIVALAGKNNIISLLTGISYEKLHILHRAAARSILVLIFIHVAARKKLGFTGDDSLSIGWIRCGITAASALTSLVILGNRFVRAKIYEVFLIIHHFFVLLILGCLIPHTGSGGYQYFVWPALLVWGVDRVLRVSRIIYSKFLQHRTTIPSKAAIEVLSSDTLRITLTLRRSRLLHWRPGQHVYLSVPTVSSTWHPLEFHPFTIANIPTDASIASIPDVEKAMHEENMQMKVIIRARDGFTARLHNYAWDSAVNSGRGGDTRFVTAYVDGPYGSPPNIGAYQTVVCIAGGSGVSFTLPLLMDIVRRCSSNPYGLLCRKVSFIWSVRNIEDVEWIAKDLKHTLLHVPSVLEVDVRVFVTGLSQGTVSSSRLPKRSLKDDPNEPTTIEKIDPEIGNRDNGVEAQNLTASSASEEHIMKSLEGNVDALLRNSQVSVTAGRAPILDILEEESKRCGDGSMLVCVSGPQSLANTVRSVLCKSSIAGVGAAMRGTNVSLHVEGFAVA